MQAIKLQVTVPTSREVTLRLPESVKPGNAELLILQENPEVTTAQFLKLVEDIASSNEPGQSIQALNERLNEERASWE